jgi:transcription elongation factor GreB
LWKLERRAVTSAVHEAAKNGGGSENGDPICNIYDKRRLREIDARVRFLNKRLDEVEVVTRRPDDAGIFFFGARKTLEDASGAEQCWHVVGTDEFDLASITCSSSDLF